MHKSRLTSFLLAVDNFGVKYVGEDHTLYLLGVLHKHYEVEVNWQGSKYCGINLEWDYDKREVHMFMQKYIWKALQRFHHTTPNTCNASTIDVE